MVLDAGILLYKVLSYMKCLSVFTCIIFSALNFFFPLTSFGIDFTLGNVRGAMTEVTPF
jgi:hypothetical protein